MTTEPRSPPETPDNRSENRQARTLQFNGELALRLPASDAEFPIAALRNVSPSGACVLMQKACEPGTTVWVLLRTRGARMEYQGNVAWSRPATDADMPHSPRLEHGPLYAVGLQILGSASFAAMLTSR